jgi:hypothetical protein
MEEDFSRRPKLALSYNAEGKEGRTPRTGDQPVARHLPKHRKTQTQNKHIHIPNIHDLYGIRTHDTGFRASKDSTCIRLLGYRDRFIEHLQNVNANNYDRLQLL